MLAIGGRIRGAEMDEKTKQAILGWLALHQGNVEQLARWMRDSLRVGGLRACRALIQEAQQ